MHTIRPVLLFSLALSTACFGPETRDDPLPQDTDAAAYRLPKEADAFDDRAAEDYEKDSAYHDFFQNWHNWIKSYTADLDRARHDGNKAEACKIRNRWTRKSYALCEKVAEKALGQRECTKADGSKGPCISGNIDEGCAAVFERQTEDCSGLPDRHVPVPELRTADPPKEEPKEVSE